MAATVYLEVDQGSDFSTIIDLQNDDNTPMNITNFSVYSQFRKSYGSVNVYNFVATIHSPLNGQIKLSLPGAFTSSIKAGRYLYDVEIISENNVRTRVLEGIVTINPEITKI